MFTDHVNYAFAVNPPIARYLDLREAKDISDIFLEDTFAKKDWVPVNRKAFTDDFGYLLDNTEEAG